MNTSCPIQTRATQAFTLMEMLIVMVVMAIVIALIIPAMGGVRDSAKAANSTALLGEITQASLQFELDHNRLPGYFSPADMGHSDNERRGFTVSQNVMLDLVGGIVGPSEDPASAADELVNIGPRSVGEDQPGGPVRMFKSRIGTTRNYFPVKPENFTKLDEGDIATNAPADSIGSLPVLVDAFGTPVLLWIANETAPRPVQSATDFVAEASDVGRGSGTSSTFYLAANAGFLNSERLGKPKKDQSHNSLLSLNYDTAATSLMGALGDPNSPTHMDPVSSILPDAARGRIIAMSAGRDGIFMDRYDEGFKRVVANNSELGIGASPVLHYRRNFFTADTQSKRILDDNGNASSEDIIKGFDDLMIFGGGAF